MMRELFLSRNGIFGRVNDKINKSNHMVNNGLNENVIIKTTTATTTTTTTTIEH